LIQHTPPRLFSKFMQDCHELSAFSATCIDKALFEDPKISEIAFTRLLSKSSQPFNLFIGNSMPIRHVDRVFYPDDFRGTLFANRGHSGIDGNIATAIGIALKQERTTIALIGDMTFWHDINSLLFLKKNPLPLIIIVFNNGGGQIFNYLEEYRDLAERQELFEMPQNLDFKQIATLFHLEYHLFDEELCIETLMRQKRSILVELVTQREQDEAHLKQLQLTLDRTIKEQAPLLYK